MSTSGNYIKTVCLHDSDEEEAIKVLEKRLHKAPSLSVNQLKNKIFGQFESDEEFRLVMHAAAPLYSEKFDADAALSNTLKTVYFAESHSRCTQTGISVGS